MVEYGALNHLINAAYLVVYEFITFEMNNVKCKNNLVSRWKQTLFDMLYSIFKSEVQDNVSRSHFQTYRRKLDFLFKICGKSIDIRI